MNNVKTVAPNTAHVVKQKRLSRISTGDRIFDVIIFVVLALVLMFTAYPLLYVISASFSDPAAVTAGKVFLWPVRPTLLAYNTVIGYESLWTGFGNSLFYVFCGTAMALVLDTMAAFPLSRKEFYGRGLFSIILAITMYVGGGIVPTYLVISKLGMLDTRWVMVLPGAVNVWYTIMVRSYFQNSIPNELYEAGQLDGCSDIAYMVRVLIPLSGPILAVIGLYQAVGIWNSYFNGMIYLTKKELYPLQVVLRSILMLGNISFDDIEDVEAVENLIGLSALMKYAVIVVASVPVMIMYPFVQRFFVKGVVVGSVKG